MKSDRLVRAVQNDTGLLTAIKDWLDEYLTELQKRSLGMGIVADEWMLLKGEARAVRNLAADIQRKAKVKDGAEDESRTRRH